MDLITVIKYVVAIVGYILSIALSVVFCIKNSNNEKAKLNILGLLHLVEDVIPFSIEFAEKSGVENGDLKKLIAVNKVKDMLSEINSSLDLNSSSVLKTINDKIEELIEFSKNVNSREESSEKTKQV